MLLKCGGVYTACDAKMSFQNFEALGYACVTRLLCIKALGTIVLWKILFIEKFIRPVHARKGHAWCDTLLWQSRKYFKMQQKQKIFPMVLAANGTYCGILERLGLKSGTLWNWTHVNRLSATSFDHSAIGSYQLTEKKLYVNPHITWSVLQPATAFLHAELELSISDSSGQVSRPGKQYQNSWTQTYYQYIF